MSDMCMDRFVAHLDFSAFVFALFGHLVWSYHLSPNRGTSFLMGLNENKCIGQHLMHFTSVLTLSIFNCSGFEEGHLRVPTVVTKHHILSSAR